MKNIGIPVIAALVLACFGLAAGLGLAAEQGTLAGSYRVLFSDGSPNDHVFTIEQKSGRWYLSAFEGEEQRPLWEYDLEFRIEEKFAEKLDNEHLLTAPCLDSGGASRMRICAVKPGEKLSWRGRSMTVTTGYFLYDGDTMFMQLEKLR